MFRTLLAAGLVVALTAGAGARPARKARHRAVAAARVEPAPPQDDLYRRRGYGQGGLVFGGGGQGGLAQACADLAFARPRNCGPSGHYGIYGNGIGYGFGF